MFEKDMSIIRIVVTRVRFFHINLQICIISMFNIPGGQKQVSFLLKIKIFYYKRAQGKLFICIVDYYILFFNLQYTICIKILPYVNIE